MRIQSPLSNLREVLAQAKAVASNPGSKTINEAVTRAVLIDPVLRALGWDVAKTQMIEVEKWVSKSSQVDYALYDSDKDIKIVIEAKQLGSKLDAQTNQLVQYIHDFSSNGIILNSILLTDGMEWRFYDDFNIAPFQQTGSVNIASGNLAEVAAFLVQKLDAANLWPDDQNVDTLADEMNQLRSDLQTLQQQVIRLTTGQPPPPPPPPPPAASWKNLDTITSVTSMKPTLLRLPDGVEMPIKFWRDVLTEMCKFVLLRVPGIPIPLPDNSGLKVNLLDMTAPSKGSAFVTDQYNGQTVYIYTNYDAVRCIANALHIIQKLPASSQTVKPAVVYS